MKENQGRCNWCGAIRGTTKEGCPECVPQANAEADAGELIATYVTNKKDDFGLAEAATKTIQTDS